MIKKICITLLTATFLWAISAAEAHISASELPTMFRGMHQHSGAQETPQIQNNVEADPQFQLMIPCPFAQIAKRYHKALQKIAGSSFSQPLRNLLVAQATENKALAIQQTEERMRLCAKQACERLSYRGELLSTPKAIKILKAIDKIAD